ncbi:MAG: hypothetical protein ACI4WS_03565 [Oscillospiraceae bacterium]
MPESKGYIKLHRTILSWEWYGDIKTRVLFIHLLLSACWEDTPYMGKLIRRGQLCSTVKELAERSGLTIRQTRTALEHLKTTGEIKVHSTPICSIITVVNYDTYQGESGATNKRQTYGNENDKPNGKPIDKPKPLETAISTDPDNGSITYIEKGTQYQSDIPKNIEATNQTTNETANKRQTSGNENDKPSLLYKEIKNIRREEYSGALRQLLDDTVSQYNAVCKSLEPFTGDLSYHQAHAVQEAYKELHGVSFEEYFRRVEASAFLTGKSSSGFKADFIWLIRPENIAKVLSGKYDVSFGETANSPEEKVYSGSLW